MNAITLYQPWASLCVLPGADGKPIKQYETRSWKRDSLLGQRIAIHAGAGGCFKGLQGLPLFKVGPILKPLGDRTAADLPTGVIVGSAVVKCFWLCHRDEHGVQFARADGLLDMKILHVISDIPFGDFSPGRWAWELTEVERLAVPIPAKGMQGVWRLTEEQEGAYHAAEKVRFAI